MRIEKKGIVLDGNGFFIKLKEDFDKPYKYGDWAVNITNGANITVRNVGFENCFGSVYANISQDITILQNNMKDSSLLIRSSNNVSCIGNNLTNSNVHVDRSSNVAFAYNKVSDYDFGVFLSVTQATVYRNDFLRLGAVKLDVGSTNCTFFENNFIDNRVGLLFDGNLQVQDRIFSNYWEGNKESIKQVDYYGAVLNTMVADSAPLASPVSTSFNASLFPQLYPTPAPSSSPSPSITPLLASPTPSPNTSIQPSPTPNTTKNSTNHNHPNHKQP